MEYNGYTTQPPHQNQQHPGSGYGHPVQPHAQHGAYQQSLLGNQPSQGDACCPGTSGFDGQAVMTEYRHPIATAGDVMDVIEVLKQSGEIQGEQNVVAVSGHDLQTTLHKMQTGLSAPSVSYLQYPSRATTMPQDPRPAPIIYSASISDCTTVESSKEPQEEQGGTFTPRVEKGVTVVPAVERDVQQVQTCGDLVKEEGSLGGPLPWGLRYRKIGEKGVCVEASNVIPKGARFGPFKGAFGKGLLHFNNILSWELTLEGRVVGYLSPVKGERAWTTSVRCAQNPAEQTAEVSQYCGQIFFTTTREMQLGEELKVFYSDDYLRSCGFKLGLSDLTYNEETKSFACPLCPCHCSTSKSLLRHMKQSHHKEKHSSINVDLSDTGQNMSSSGCNESVTCLFCGDIFQTVERLLEHKKRHKGNGSVKHMCCICGFIFNDRATLSTHTKSHKQAPHGCEKCGQVFKIHQQLLHHEKNKHPMPKIVKIKLRVRKQPNCCATCGFMCSSRKILDEHVRRHKELPHGCPVCGSMYRKRHTLLRHLRVAHSAEKQRERQTPMAAVESTEFRCPACFFNCPDADAFKDHQEKHEHGPYGCDECGLVYTQKQFAARHKRDKHGAMLPMDHQRSLLGDQVFPSGCDECSKTYRNEIRLKRHQRKVHGRESEPRCKPSKELARQQQCYICEATFDEDVAVKVHLRDEHRIVTAISRETVPGVVAVQSNALGGMRCNICSQTFTKSVQLQAHMEQHCATEGGTDNSSSQFADASTGGDKFPSTDAVTATASGQIDMLGKSMDYFTKPHPFKCKECSQRFVSKYSMQAHMAKVHLLWSYKYVCSFCQRGFKQESHLLIHIQVHTKMRPFQCSLCPRSFASQSAYDNHHGEHTGAKPHKCDVCGRGFRTPKSMKNHKHRVHSGLKPYKCSFCDKRFYCQREMKLHERRHTGIRPYVCLTCGMAFKDRNGRNVHNRVHSGERPFVCPYCKKAFKQPTTLSYHMTLHTRSSTEQATAITDTAQS